MPKEVKKVVKEPPVLAPGESIPSGGMGIVRSGLFATLYMLVPMVIGAGVTSMSPEKWLRQRVHFESPMASPMLAGLFHIFVLQWLAMRVNSARAKYHVPWPTLYLESTHPHATAYNCAQRAHQHVLEQTPTLLVLVLIASAKYPLSAGAFSALFSFSKIVGNVIGYASGDSRAKNRGAFGYIGLLFLIGLAELTALSKAGWLTSFTGHLHSSGEYAAPYVAQAKEALTPYANHAVVTMTPYANQAVDAMSPYSSMAYETVAPYMESVAPYAQTAVNATRPLVDAAVSFFLD